MRQHTQSKIVVLLIGVLLGVCIATDAMAQFTTTFTPACGNNIFTVNDNNLAGTDPGFWVKSSQILPGAITSPGVLASSYIIGSNFHMTSAGGSFYNDAGIAFFFNCGGIRLGDLISVSVNGLVAPPGTHISVNLWLDTGGDGQFFAFDSNGKLTGLAGDSYYGADTQSVTSSTVFSSFAGPCSGTFTLADLQSGTACPGIIDGNTPLALWVGITPGETADISGVTVTTANPLPAGCGCPVPRPIPTFSEWGMIIFMILIGLGAVYYIRKHRRVES